jgi:hypothetical protein
MNMVEIDAKVELGWKSRGAQPISTCLAKTTHNITGHLSAPLSSLDELHIGLASVVYEPDGLEAEGRKIRYPSVMSKLFGTYRKMKTFRAPHPSYPYCAQSKEKKCSAIQESTSASLSGSPSKSKNQSTSSQR